MTLPPQYSLIVRETEWEIAARRPRRGLGLLPSSPLGGGWLSGKYQRDEPRRLDARLGEDPGRGMEAWKRLGPERPWRIIEAVQIVAEESGARWRTWRCLAGPAGRT